MQSGTGTYYDDLHHTADDRKSRQCGYDRGKTRGRLGGNEFSRPELDYDKLAEIDTDRPDLPAEVIEQVNILIKYDGYISRQIKQVEKFKKLEKKKLPEKFDYNEISGLRIEAQQKLNEFQPLNIGQASRISGVTPADISVLLVYLEQLKYSNPDLFFKLNPDEHKEKQE